MEYRPDLPRTNTVYSSFLILGFLSNPIPSSHSPVSLNYPMESSSSESSVQMPSQAEPAEPTKSGSAGNIVTFLTPIADDAFARAHETMCEAYESVWNQSTGNELVLFTGGVEAKFWDFRFNELEAIIEVELQNDERKSRFSYPSQSITNTSSSSSLPSSSSSSPTNSSTAMTDTDSIVPSSSPNQEPRRQNVFRRDLVSPPYAVGLRCNFPNEEFAKRVIGRSTLVRGCYKIYAKARTIQGLAEELAKQRDLPGHGTLYEISQAESMAMDVLGINKAIPLHEQEAARKIVGSSLPFRGKVEIKEPKLRIAIIAEYGMY